MYAAGTRFGRPIASGTQTTGLLELRGRLRNAAGETAVGAKGRVLVLERL